VPTTRSIFRNLLFSIADNSTLSIRHRAQGDGSGHLQRLGRDVKFGGEQETVQLHRDVEESEEHGQIWDLGSENIAVPEEPRREAEELLSNKPNPFVKINDPFQFVEGKVDTPPQPAPRYGHAACM
jgi:hypothetical protein